jgi:isopenicillin N synthase-like dioxygenase
MYVDSNGNKLDDPNDDDAGLYIQARSGDIVRVQLHPDALGFQIGETSQIQSGGILQATPHAVQASKQLNMTRESFAVFLEPEFDDPLSLPSNKTVEDVQDRPLPSTVIPLKARWKPGQTFGDFHLATVSAFATT